MRAIDLFAGCGGLSLGLRQAGIEVVAAVEWEKDACATYRANLGDHLIEADITTVDPDRLPDCDLIAGGPPCQGFSTAGKRDPNDPRNRLWEQYFRIVAAKRPAWILIENVPGLLTMGEDKAIVLAFREIGYDLSVVKLNAADYGVPQNRYRVFFIGNRLGVANPVPVITHLGPKKDRHKKPVRAQLGLLDVQPHVTVRQALGLVGMMTHKYSVTPALEGDGRTSPWYDSDDPARAISHAPHGMLDAPSGTIRSGVHGQPGYSPRHQAGYVPVLDDASQKIRAAGAHVSHTSAGRLLGGFVPDEVSDDDERLDRDGLTVTHGQRRGKRYSTKHPGNFVPELAEPDEWVDQPSVTIRGANGGSDLRADGLARSTMQSTRPYGWIPTDREDHGVLDLDEPACAIKAGGATDASGHIGGATPPALPLMIRDKCPDDGSRSPARAIGVDSRYEIIEPRLRNRYAGHGDGAGMDDPAPAMAADRGLELHELYDVTPTIQGDARVSEPGHHAPGQPRMATRLRRLTVRECATLQDFPPDFVFVGSKTSQHRQIGNAAPSGLARALGQAIRVAHESAMGSGGGSTRRGSFGSSTSICPDQ